MWGFFLHLSHSQKANWHFNVDRQEQIKKGAAPKPRPFFLSAIGSAGILPAFFV
jgi:hypothetical protein